MTNKLPRSGRRVTSSAVAGLFVYRLCFLEVHQLISALPFFVADRQFMPKCFEIGNIPGIANLVSLNAIFVLVVDY